jgi:hypothetical protein
MAFKLSEVIGGVAGEALVVMAAGVAVIGTGETNPEDCAGVVARRAIDVAEGVFPHEIPLSALGADIFLETFHTIWRT